VRHCIYWNHFIDSRFGGPTGYLAHLKTGLDAVSDKPIDISFEVNGYSGDVSTLQNSSCLGSQQALGALSYFSNLDNFCTSNEALKKIMDGGTRSVHVHTSAAAFSLRQAFEKNQIKSVPIILSSHCPESFGKEYADQFRVPGVDANLADKIEIAVRDVEQQGFETADIWIFPSPEAMEPYRNTIPNFERWAKEKDIRYVASGVNKPNVSVTREQAKIKFGVSGKFVITFIGRHNKVKGYDIFCEALSSLLKIRNDVFVLVAGAESIDITPPKDQNWKELGWYAHPGDVLSATDLFVLPNRQTYFDLILLEAISLNVPVIASSTGGNKSVEALTGGGILLYQGGAEQLRDAISSYMDDAILKSRLLERLRPAYVSNFSPEKFSARYIKVIEEIWRDLDLDNTSALKKFR
jgi:glycosyltransferase involved in cell wall biosynthesis